MLPIERRFLKRQLGAFRSYSPDSPGVLVGYASVYGSLSEDLGGFRERVARGAVDKSLRDRADVRALVNHDPNLILGRVRNGTLTLSSDETGLLSKIQLPNTSYGRDLWESVARGDVSEMSFAFQAEDEDWADEDDPDDPDQRIRVRTLKGAQLLDVSAVVYPAYESTSVHISSVDPSLVMGRSLFPEGIPVEVRKRVGNIGNTVLNFKPQERRRALTNLLLS